MNNSNSTNKPHQGRDHVPQQRRQVQESQRSVVAQAINDNDTDTAASTSTKNHFHESQTQISSTIQQTRLFRTPRWNNNSLPTASLAPYSNHYSHDPHNDYNVRRRRRPPLPVQEYDNESNHSTTNNTEMIQSSATTTAIAEEVTRKSSRTRFTRGSEKRRRIHAATSHWTNTCNRRSSSLSSSHLVCAISENLARETCISLLDATAPIGLIVCKQGNGQAYEETVACLQQLQPDEVLLNEGRKNSPLGRKILELYDQDPSSGVDSMHSNDTASKRSATTDNSRYTGQNNENWPNNYSTYRKQNRSSDEEEVETSAVVKFVSRGLFDQTRGATLLRQIARDDCYDPMVVEEYILLSSAHAVIMYVQSALGAHLSPKSLRIHIHAGGISNECMTIDRTTLWQLELLANAKTGKSQPSLIGTINKTKTTVGSRLLRTNLMSPPKHVRTIEARLELVETFLHHEEFFYSVYEHLRALPDVDKMLSHIALTPNRRNDMSGSSDADEPSDQLVRRASKGIASLVAVKAVLRSIPSLLAVLQKQLDQVDGRSSHANATATIHRATPATCRTSLQVGLGGAAMSIGRSANVNQGTSPGVGSTGTHQNQSNFLLRAIASVLQLPELRLVLQQVSDVFTESTTYSRNANNRQHQECFALKDQEENGMLSLLRQSFKTNVDAIYKAADDLAEEHNLHVTVRYSTARGYFLSIPAISTELPNAFLHPTKSGRIIYFETAEVASLNRKAQSNVRDILIITHDRIQQVLVAARENYDALANLCDAIALLDMCHSFADLVTLGGLKWCRPLVGRGVGLDDASRSNGADDDDVEMRGAMMIRNGRYPIVVPDQCSETGDGPTDFIPNDTYVYSNTTFTVITGVNGAGKSTYLKQIAIVTVLAHIGCYVPAEQALIPVFDRLCTRIGNADDQEHNISTFMQEMKETAFICNNATDDSLILLDELGRATSNEDGVAIAWAVSEYLLTCKSMVFFVTHYPQLATLADVYPGVQNVHLQARLSSDNGVGLTYTHKVQAGCCKATSEYGVELASYCGWSPDVWQCAKELEGRVRASLPSSSLCADSHQEAVRPSSARGDAHGLLAALSRMMKDVCQESRRSGSLSGLRSDLIDLQERFRRECANNPDMARNANEILCRARQKSTLPATVDVGDSRPGLESRTLAHASHDSRGFSLQAKSDSDYLGSRESSDGSSSSSSCSSPSDSSRSDSSASGTSSN